MAGTNSQSICSGLGVGGVDLVGVDAEFLLGLGEVLLGELAGPRQLDERRPGRVVRVDLEVAAEGRTGIAAAEAVGPEREEAAREPLGDHLRDRAHVVADRDDRTLGGAELRYHVRDALFLVGM